MSKLCINVKNGNELFPLAVTFVCQLCMADYMFVDKHRLQLHPATTINTDVCYVATVSNFQGEIWMPCVLIHQEIDYKKHAGKQVFYFLQFFC